LKTATVFVLAGLVGWQGGAAAATGGTAAPPSPTALELPLAGVVGAPLAIRGRAPGDRQPLAVEAERQAGGRWQRVATVTPAGDGGFATTWTPTAAGAYTLRLRSALAHSARAVGWPEQRLLIYRSRVASFYGPGLYGHATACGERLTRHLVGVASPTLPCGTPVAFRYGKRTLVVPVVDRGPFVPGVAYDLTAAAARRLGIDETVRVWSLPLLGASAQNLGATLIPGR